MLRPLLGLLMGLLLGLLLGLPLGLLLGLMLKLPLRGLERSGLVGWKNVFPTKVRFDLCSKEVLTMKNRRLILPKLEQLNFK